MALDTLGAGTHFKKDLAVRGLYRRSLLTLLLVKMMGPGIVFGGLVALEAQIVAFQKYLCTVNVMAVAAADIPVVHLALGEGAVHIYLFKDLSVRKI